MNQRKKQIDRDNKSKALWVAARVTFASILGVLLLFLFGTNVSALMSHYCVSACYNLYEDRELEILSYRAGPNTSSEDPLVIKGVIHPDGIEIVTNDNSVSLMSLNGSDALIQMAPSEESVIGKRIKVRYYVGKDEDRRWWQPSRVHNEIKFTDRAVTRLWIMAIVYFGAMLASFEYAARTKLKYAHLAKYLSSDES